MTTKSLKIEGMSCHHCVIAPRKCFEMLDGEAYAHIEVGKANVSIDETKADSGKLLETVSRTGSR